MLKEEEAYERFYDEKWKLCSEAACTVFAEADHVVYPYNMVRTVGVDPAEFDEALEKMRFAAAELTGPDRMILSELVRVAYATSESIDPCDGTYVSRKVDRGGFHRYYRLLAGMI